MEQSPGRSKRVAAGEIVLGIALIVFGIVSHIWFAYIVAVVAFAFAIFVWGRANSRGDGRGGDSGAFRS
jgi:hypothetical protein